MANNFGMPIPFLQNVLAVFRMSADPGMVALAAKVDYWVAKGCQEVAAYLGFWRPEQTPASMLGEFGYHVSAGILPGDSDRTQRQKIYGAVEGHKHRGQWAADCKPKIDAITGASASIFNALGADWPVDVGDGVQGMTYPWSEEGGDGVLPDIIEVGSGNEGVWAGLIQVDVGTAALTPAQVAQVVQAIATDVVPVYFRVFLGYTVGGQFNNYAGGQIG